MSKRFYELVTTPYAWRAAFLRNFPGQDALVANRVSQSSWDHESSDVIKSEARYFARLTSLASWRSEYLLRTRLLRSVNRGKPGSIGVPVRSSQSGKKAGAVLTYNSKLPWMITHIDAAFSGGKKGPRVVHGTAGFGIGTVSDPTTGRIEKWGLDDPFALAQLDEMFPNLEYFGVGDGPAAVPNVMDVSQQYGIVAGEGFPGGRVFFRAAGALRGRYLGQDNAIIDMVPEIPKIPELSDAISAVWIAKSPNVPSTTQSMVGILAGSTLGVVTSYALGYESSGSRFANGEMTARWVLSPGVPIIDLKVDDSYYNQRRRGLGRVWAVALNALGEVYYLTTPPTPSPTRGKKEDTVRDAWHAGRTTYWELVEPTRRIARPDELDKNAVRGAYSPRTPANSLNLSKEQIIAESREIEKFLRYKPAHFRHVCQGWDMRRKLEVDFASGDDRNSGETVFVVTCGDEEAEQPAVRRYVRSTTTNGIGLPGVVVSPSLSAVASGVSIFGGFTTPPVSATVKEATNPWPVEHPQAHQFEPISPVGDKLDEWRVMEYSLKIGSGNEITASAVDMSTFALLAPFEDPLQPGSQPGTPGTTNAPARKRELGEIPGRRSRMLAVGTSTGSIFVWNMRDNFSSPVVSPVRVIHTESPSISSIALSALYLVHGGSDGLVQAWDPLASSTEPVRTLSAKSTGRIPRHILHANPALQNADYFAVGAIFLDPDPTVLRGILSFGTFLRSWSYSTTGQGPGRKRRLRHSDVHGRPASRRNGDGVSSFIAAEEEELRREQERRSRELARLRARFGVGLADLTDEEAVMYAQLVSEESFMQDEQRRSASDTGSAADVGETGSSADSTYTLTPEPSISGASPSGSSLPPLHEEEADGDYEAQIQRAIRLSLMEGVNEPSQSPRDQSSGEFEFQVKVKTKKGKGKGKQSATPSPSSTSMPAVNYTQGSPWNGAVQSGSGDYSVGLDADDELALALRLSMEEEQARLNRLAEQAASGEEIDEFPALEVVGKGKGKCI